MGERGRSTSRHRDHAAKPLARASIASGFLLASVLAVGCGEEEAWRPALQAPAAATAAIAGGRLGAAPVPVYGIQVGAEVPISGGTKVAYVLTSNAPGSYRFRWTSDAVVAHSPFRKFTGSVWTTGHFTSLVPGCADGSCPLEDVGDYVSEVQQVPGGEQIDWATSVLNGWDGFSFTTDAEPLYFTVNVEGESRPDLFVFPSTASGGETEPVSNPFGIRSAM